VHWQRRPHFVAGAPLPAYFPRDLFLYFFTFRLSIGAARCAAPRQVREPARIDDF
jgi:hypothetical protein